MHRSLSARLAALALAATALVAIQSATGAQATADGPMYGAPKAGTCYSVSAKVARTQSATAAVAHSCKKSHTLWVYAVGRAPADVALTPITNNPGLNAAVRKICDPAFNRKIGKLDRTWGLSSYESYTFVPTAAQQSHGAHWISCEVGLEAGANRLATTRVVKPAHLSPRPAKLFHSCVTATYYWTNCAARHAYRATYTQVFTSTVANANGKTLTICRKHLPGNKWVYAAKPLAGTRWVAVCSAKTRH